MTSTRYTWGAFTESAPARRTWTTAREALAHSMRDLLLH